MITCRNCGSENEAEAGFCGNCGMSLAAAAVDDSVVPGAARPAPGAKPAPEDTTEPKTQAEPEGQPAPNPVPEPDRTADAKPELTPELKPVPTPPLPSPLDLHPVLDANSVRCAVCGTVNPIDRSFCRKCANPLRAIPVTKRSRIDRDLISKFLVAAVVATVVVVGGGALVQRFAPSNVAQLEPGVAVNVVDESGAQAAFELQPAEPQPLEALPDTATLQLASYEESAAETPGPSAGGATETRPKWWSDGIPRIPAISQFDGGKLQGVNCVMAAGAMLARLGYGVVTTGSQLRALSNDPDGPTSFNDLQNAVYRGWGIRFQMGAASPLQFRALVFAGAGAELIVVYGEIPVGIRLQESFRGNHAIYIDAFRPAGPEGPAAYYVMDPIGHTWSGYKGQWWPADVVERAATAFGGGRMITAWTFAGGKVPFVHPVLPPSGYPPNTPGETPGPGQSLAPGETLVPGPTLAPGETLAPGQSPGSGGVRDPFNFGDLPFDVHLTAGDPPPDIPEFPRTDFLKDVYLMEPGLLSAQCTTKPIPPDCPFGVVGIVGELGLLQPTREETNLKLLYGDVIGPGVYRIIYEAPPDSDGKLLLWDSKSGGSLLASPSEAAILDGKSVQIATVTVDPAVDYTFMASASTDGVRSISSVGTVKVSP